MSKHENHRSANGQTEANTPRERTAVRRSIAGQLISVAQLLRSPVRNHAGPALGGSATSRCAARAE